MHGVVEAQSDPALRDVHNAAGMVVPDGMPMVWASHRVGIPWAERCYGPDLMLEMCRRAAATGHRFYFYGGAEGTPERLRDRLVEQFPGLQVVGLHSPPFRPLTPEEDEAILDEIGATEEQRIKPEILSSQVIRHLDDRQTQLINRVRHGHMIVAGQSLYTLEVQPAANAALAANEAEKAARINVLEIVTFGSLGRVYLAGKDRDIDVASVAAKNAIESLSGREASSSRKD